VERPGVRAARDQSDGRRKAKVHVELGQAYFQAGRFGVALDEARAAATYDSGYAPALSADGAGAYVSGGECEMAEANFAHALKLAPGDPEVMNSYGWFLCSVRQGAGRARAL
jgi:type IV pilus assembly protein PilF